MQKLITIIIAGLFTTVLYSCTCANLDCISDNYSGQFHIVSSMDSTDLVFGRQRIYDKDQIRFYTLKGTDTVFFDYTTPTGYGLEGFEDSILSIWFYPRSDTAYMHLGNGDIDTLAMSFDTRTTKCCGTITEITNFRFNNRQNLLSGETQVIRK